MQSNIDILKGAKYTILESQDGYEKGVKDAWNLAFKIAGSPDNGCYDNKELVEIFDCMDSCDVFDNYSYTTALRLVEEYEKKKKEKYQPIIGDVVKIIHKDSPKDVYYGIYLGLDGNAIYIMERGCSIPSCYHIAYYKIFKTDQHVDLEGWNAD